MISTNPLNEINSHQLNYTTFTNEVLKNAFTTLSSLSNTFGNNCATLNNKSHIKVNKRDRGFSYEIPHELRVPSSMQKEENYTLHQKRNHSLNLNRFALNNFIISSNKEKQNKKGTSFKKEEISENRHNVKRNLNLILNNITVKGKKIDSRNSALNQIHQPSLSNYNNNIKNSKNTEVVEIVTDRIQNENLLFPI